MTLPKDPYILLSYLNTMLRDRYDSLAALCEDLNVEQAALETQMQAISYYYDSEHRQFVRGKKKEGELL